MIIQHNYMRMYRKKSRLTQADVAHILGLEDGSNVSKWEHGERQPGVEALLAYHLVFDLPVEMLFERQRRALAQAVAGRIGSLIDGLRDTPDEHGAAQRASYLEAALARLNAAYGQAHG